MSGALAKSSTRTIDVVVDEGEEPLVPPFSLDAEAAVLSAVMLDKTAMGKVADFLRPKHFYSEAHRIIYAACELLHRECKPIDVVLVADVLRDRKRLEQAGGVAYMAQVLDASPVVTNVRDHALVVHDKWRARGIIAAAQRVAAQGYDDYGDAQGYADRAAKAMLDVARDTVLGKAESNLDTLKRIVKGIDARAKASESDSADDKIAHGIPYGLPCIDRWTNGMHGTHKITISALPGVGKTALAMQLVFGAAERGVGGLVFSTEVGREELLEREICRRAGIDSTKLKATPPQLTPLDWSKITQAASEIAKLPVVILDDAPIHIGQVAAATRAHLETFRVEHGAPLGIVCVDYVQNLSAPPELLGKKEHEVVKHSTVAFKNLLKETSLVGLELAQRKPGTATIDPRTKIRPRPGKTDVADSSWVSNAADVLLFIHRNPLIDDTGKVRGESRSDVSIIAPKQRGGSEFEERLVYDGANFRFRDPNDPGGWTPSRQYVDPNADYDSP